tara:strand:+ start:4727 stop:6088 length:1362 start_codon:yes stop_codon:yes gene_type:complete
MAEAQGQKEGPSFIDYAVLTSIDGSNDVDISSGIVNFRYYESILQDGVMGSVMFADSGNTINNKTIMEGLPLTGSEYFQIKVKDNNNVELKQRMIVSNPTPISEESNKTMVVCSLVSEAYAKNDNTSIFERFDGKISDHVEKILTDNNYLATTKGLDVEITSNNLSEFGLRRKPYFMLNSFAKKSVPDGGLGDVAGYFFFETSDKMIFKSIDSLFDKEKNKPKRSIIYNESTAGMKLTDVINGGKKGDIPAGYDYKALTYDRTTSDAMSRNKMGANSTATITFNPFTQDFKRTVMFSPAIEQTDQSSGETNEPLSTAGLDLPAFNPSLVKEFARTTISLFDVGTFDDEPKSENESDFEIEDILNQSIMRYNQVFATKVNITIAGDFDLHAGDMIFFDAPSPQSDTKNDEVDRQSGGLYIIASLCHFISPKRTLSKLTLIRDSFGRTGNHTLRD